MAIETAAKPYGYYITCTSGTAVAAAVTPQVAKGNALRVTGLVCGGSAATDITRVYDTALNFVYIGSAAATAVSSITFPNAYGLRLDGLCVGMSGGTAAWCMVITQ